MFSKDRIINSLQKKCYVEYSISSEPVKRLKGFLFAEDDVELDKNMAFIVPSKKLEGFLSRDISGMTLICPSHKEHKLLDRYEKYIPPTTTLICPDLPVGELVNELITLYREESILAKQYQIATDTDLNVSLQEIARIASERLGITVVVLSSSYVKLGAGLAPNACEMVTKTFGNDDNQNINDIKAFIDNLNFISNRNEHSYYNILNGKMKSMVSQIPINDKIAGYLLFILDDYPKPNYFLSELEQVTFYVEKILRKRASTDLLYGAFNTLVNQIISGEILSRDTVLDKLSHIPQPIYGQRFRFILICFDDVIPDHKWAYIANQVHNIFPLSNLAKYGPNLAIFSKNYSDELNDSKFSNLCNIENFKNFLEEHNAYGAIGASSKYLSAAYTMYQQCYSTIRIAKKMRKDKQERIFDYEDYSIYLFIEMCVDSRFETFHQGKLFYLCHQDFLTIARYDRKNGTDYLDILYHYLANNCKIAQTSRALFLHRNTLLGKIEKIQQIIGKDLSDSFLRERLLFSYHVTEYANDYLGQDIFPASIID